ncbi:hypothetical protein D3C85_1659950 [compost metagenome]
MTAFFSLFDVSNGAHHHATSAGHICLLHRRSAIDGCPCREVRTLDVLQKVISCDVLIIDQLNCCIDQLAKVM